MKLKMLKILLKVLAAIGLFSLLTVFLWNILMPDLFGLPSVSFFQAMGLLALTRLLFGGFGVIRDMGHFMARRERQAIFESWHSMTPEQRAQFLARTRSHSARSSVPDFGNTGE